MHSPPSTANEPAAGRRSRWRFLVQFSLRSLLMLTALVAVGCWWFLRPTIREEVLEGTNLKLQRAVRIRKAELKKPNNVWRAQELIVIGQTQYAVTNVGRWQLRDADGNLLVSGQFANDQRTGRWTVYHPSGHRAAHGYMVNGAKDSLWRSWDDRGRMLSEVTYKAVPRKLPADAWPRIRGMPGPVIPVVGSLAPLAQTSPWNLAIHNQSQYESIRHGPAKNWFPSGQLRFEGAYHDDRRTGLWTFYDEQGGVTGKREYK